MDELQLQPALYVNNALAIALAIKRGYVVLRADG